MKHTILRASAFVLAISLSIDLQAQTGPDVIVGDLPDVANYGSVGSIAAFSVGTTSCNVGTQDLSWVASTNQHPVIALNMYKVKDGRIEQIGMSWLKHGFTALTQNLCGTCNGHGGSVLGVGCSDPYGAGLNGSQSGLGPRSEVNASTGYFLFPPQHMPSYPATIGRRIQVAHADLDPALNSGARYFVEGHYVTPDDALAGNGRNNASYREVTVTPNGGSYNLALIGATQRTKPAILAWQDLDSRVVIQEIDVASDGRIQVGLRAIDLRNGRYRFEYAVHNLNSDRSVRRFSVPLPPGASLTNMTFHDVDYHSNEVYSTTDWSASSAGGIATWNTATYASNINANAIRWSTTYSFSFESDMVPSMVELELFKPGPAPSVIQVPLFSQPCPLGGGNSGGGGGPGTYNLDTNAAYDFVDISSNGFAGPSSDDGNVVAPIGFPFTFFGNVINDVVINSNGMIYLNTQSGSYYQNTLVPGGGDPAGQVAAYWDDLNPSVAGSIYYRTVGTAPNRRFVVMWDGVAFFGGSASQTETFCIILDEAGDKITTSWRSTSRGGDSASLGIEAADGVSGVSAAYNQSGSVVAGRSHVYTPAGYPETATLTVTGDGTAGSIFGVSVLGVENSPFFVLMDLTPGPTMIPNFGEVHIGFSPSFVILLDGWAIPAFSTNACGVFDLQLPVGPVGLPSGLSLYFSAIIWESSAPNGVGHLSNGQVMIVP